MLDSPTNANPDSTSTLSPGGLMPQAEAQRPTLAQSDGITRRTVLRGAAVGGLSLSVGSLLAACGSNNKSSTTTGGGSSTSSSVASSSSIPSAADFEASSGTDIPTATVRFAQWPYGDTTIGFIGIKQGLFKDVGIDVSPANGETLTTTQTPQQLLNNQIDIASGFMPNVIQTYVKEPTLKMIQFTDTYIGNYILANPSLKAKTYADFTGEGMSFAKAFTAVVQQMKGKKVALSNTGSNRTFFQTILQLGGLSSSDISLQVIPDNTIVQLGKAGSIDFGFPSGAAQSAELIQAGFQILAGASTLIDGLPLGTQSVATSIGHAGLEASIGYVTKNLETVLRFQSVFYKIIDQIQNTPSILKLSLPILDSTAGVNLKLSAAELLFKEFYGLIGYAQSPTHLLDKTSPYYYESVYKTQIAAAVKGGVIPASANVTPDDLSVCLPLYEIQTALKGKYDSMLASGGGKNKAAAAKQYAAFNYLDAYRMLRG
jgi:ABC-type nitrate/sulfonate/bicarbonate transport system substrate-binding protein